MNISISRNTISRNKDHLLLWLATTLILMAFGLGDAAVVAWSAALVSPGQLVAAALAFGLIGIGGFVTVWQIRQ